MNTNGTTGKFWDHYQKPQLEEVLKPIQRASELERAYYLRFLQFIETEHLMSKVGNQTMENSGFADKWHSSLDDKLMAGNIYYNMRLLIPSADQQGEVEQVTLGLENEADRDTTNFRPGDIVILYPYQPGEEPDARHTMVFRCSIDSIADNHIVLHLRSSQANAQVFWRYGEMRWAIEHDFFESSYQALYRGMHAFLSAPKERRDLLLLQRAPRQDKSLQLKGDYGEFNTLSLKAKQATDLFLIIGPPGTGKTSYGLLNTLKEELASSEGSVLLLSFTNRAVDEICGKLVEEGIDFIRIGNPFSCEKAYRHYLLESKVEQCQTISQLRDVILQTRVFTATTSALNTNVNLLQMKQFKLAIIDEASQILEPHLAGLLSATYADGTSAIKKMVFIGDHKQLPAVVQQKIEESQVYDPALQRIHLTNCRLSLFERLLRQYKDNPDVVYMLTKQGRMHHDIALFPNITFYENKLREVPLPHQICPLSTSGKGENSIEDLLQTRRISFIDLPSPEDSVSDKVNKYEALAIAATVVKIFDINSNRFSPSQTVGVIVPYRQQIGEIRRHIEAYGIPALREITIDTVERFQGSQRDYIIYGFTVQKHYQLSFLTNHVFEEDGSVIDRKLNVAMTRAREHLIMFGHARLLDSNLTFHRLMEHAKSRQSYFSMNVSDYVKGNFDTALHFV